MESLSPSRKLGVLPGSRPRLDAHLPSSGEWRQSSCQSLHRRFKVKGTSLLTKQASRHLLGYSLCSATLWGAGSSCGKGTLQNGHRDLGTETLQFEDSGGKGTCTHVHKENVTERTHDGHRGLERVQSKGK